MKKMFLGFAALISSFFYSQQKNSDNDNVFGYGIKAGLNMSWLNSSDVKSRAGFHAGVFAHLPLSNTISIQPELMYSTYGGKLKNEMITDNIKSDILIRFNSVVLPIMIQYHITPKLFAELGPELGFIINPKYVMTNFSVSAKKNFKNFNAGLALGAGYNITPKLGITARYVKGMSNISKDLIKMQDVSLVNNAFQIGFTYRLK